MEVLLLNFARELTAQMPMKMINASNSNNYMWVNVPEIIIINVIIKLHVTISNHVGFICTSLLL